MPSRYPQQSTGEAPVPRYDWNDPREEGPSPARGEPSATMTPNDRTIVTREDIERGLREVGLEAGDVALVHSSLSSMGWVEGGTDTVIEACLGVLDRDEGTFVVPTLCSSKPRDKRFEVWDIDESPSDVGAITEAVRLHPDAVRSDHGTHSVAAIGAQAEEVTSGHATADGRPSPWGPAAFGFGSPWQWLYDHNAHYLFLGVTMSVNTIGHFAQAEFVRSVLEDVPADHREKLAGDLRAWQRGGVWPNFKFATAEEWLKEKGAMRYAEIGEATLRATRATVNVDTIIARFNTEGGSILEDDFLDWLERAKAAKESRE
ncbi:MAG: AAC(3) family N-acetyltransferase [Armatimonadota bacterium]